MKNIKEETKTNASARVQYEYQNLWKEQMSLKSGVKGWNRKCMLSQWIYI